MSLSLHAASVPAKKPEWLRQRAPQGENFVKMQNLVSSLRLNTVCKEAKCPNIGECWGSEISTLTIMLMGDQCTRGCRFCAVSTSKNPPPVDINEPERVAAAIKVLSLGYAVLTSVDRDDLHDGGSGHFAYTVKLIKERCPSTYVECLVPDFRGDHNSIAAIATSGLDVFAHNIETVNRLQRVIRDSRAGYQQSLSVLKCAKEIKPNLFTKSSLMLGLGEKDDEIKQALDDLKEVGVDIVTFGQYLQPEGSSLRVKEYITEEKFDYWKSYSESIRFRSVASGPLVRSSYKAGESFVKRRGC